MATCLAGVTTEGHCCHQLGVVCPFLREDAGADRRWVCTFRERLGSWRAVHRDHEYLDTIGPIMLGMTGVLCGDWPPQGKRCAECGTVG